MAIMVDISTGRTMGVILALFSYFLVQQEHVTLVHAQRDMGPIRQRPNLCRTYTKEAKLLGGHGNDARLLERNLVQNNARILGWKSNSTTLLRKSPGNCRRSTPIPCIIGTITMLPVTVRLSTGTFAFLLDPTTLTIHDWGDDGLCCGGGQGYYEFFVSGVWIKHGGVYDAQEWTLFDVVGSPTVSPSPTAAPSPVPNTPTQAPSSAPTVQCSPGEHLIKVDIKLDDFPTETSWTLTNSNNNVVLAGGNYSPHQALDLVSAQDCLPADAYTFTIVDVYGDGICCSSGEGFYRVSIDGNEVEYEPGDFGATESKIVVTPGATVPPTASPQPSASPTGSPQPTPLWTSGPTIFWPSFPTPSPTPAPAVTCASDEVVLAVDLMLDSDTNATSWDVTDSAGTVIWSRGDYTYEPWKVHNELCLPTGSYVFTINDMQGDGLVWGYYKLWMHGVLVKKGGPFGSQESTALESVPNSSP